MNEKRAHAEAQRKHFSIFSLIGFAPLREEFSPRTKRE